MSYLGTTCSQPFYWTLHQKIWTTALRLLEKRLCWKILKHTTANSNTLSSTLSPWGGGGVVQRKGWTYINSSLMSASILDCKSLREIVVTGMYSLAGFPLWPLCIFSGQEKSWKGLWTTSAAITLKWWMSWTFNLLWSHYYSYLNLYLN